MAIGVVAGFLVINVLITLWAFVAVSTLWPELAPTATGAPTFAPPNHPAFKLEMLVNVPVALAAGYVCARLARGAEVAAVCILGALLLSLSAAYFVGTLGAEFGAAKPLWAHAGTAVGLVVGLAGGTWLRLRGRASSQRLADAVSRGGG